MARKSAPPKLDEERESASDMIVRDIVRGLYENRYAAGQRLAEPDLMRWYGVGRSSVREAIKRLAAEGVVTSHPFRGAEIRHLTRRQAGNVFVVLGSMIGLAAELAAANVRNGTKADAFLHACEALEEQAAAGDEFEFMRARNRFYRTMTELGGNDELARLLPSIHVHMVRAMVRGTPSDRLDDYRAMADAIMAGDPARAERAGRRHVEGLAKAVDQAPDSFFARERE